MDEDVLARVRLYFRQNECTIGPPEFTDHVNHHNIAMQDTKIIFGNSPIRWMQILGLQYFEARKGIFVNGHKRFDFLGFRTIFVKRMADLEVQIPVFSMKEMEIKIWPVGEQMILLTQDENTFAAHDGQKNLWLQNGSNHFEKKEWEGQSMSSNSYLMLGVAYH